MINKGGVDVDDAGGPGSFFIDSMYVPQRSVPDVGICSNDLAGNETYILVSVSFQLIPFISV